MTAAAKLEDSMGAGSALALAEALARRVELTERLCRALAAQDPRAVRALVPAVQESSRSVNAAGANLQQLDLTSPPMAEMRTLLGQLAARAQSADDRMHEVVTSAGFGTLGDWLGAVEGVSTLLAEPWEPAHDLAVLLGADAPALVPLLVARGQKRILCQTSPAVPTPAEALGFERLDELDAACWRFGLPLPTRFRLHSAGAGALPAEPIAARLQEALPNLGEFGRALHQMAPEFLAYCSRNLANIASHPSAQRLDGVFEGVPAVIVAAGPSLDKNIARLKEVKGRAVIIAINQTVRALRRAGVQPDIVLACDYQNLAYQFEGVQPGEIPALGLGASVRPDLFAVPANHTFTFAASPILENWIYGLLGEEAGTMAAGTVSVSALFLALRMGCSPISVIGLDLALAGRKYYADGAADGGHELAVAKDGSLNLSSHESKLRLGSETEQEHYRGLLNKRLDLVEVPGFFGQPVQTTSAMRRQLLALRAQLSDLRGRVELINATEGGSFIEGMDHRPFAEVIARCTAEVDVKARLATALAPVDAKARKARLGEIMAGLNDDLQKAVALASRCLKGLRNQGLADARSVAKLREVSRKLPFLGVLASAELCDISRATQSVQATPEQLDSAEAALYRSIETEGTKLVPLFTEAIRTLKL